MMAKPLPGSLRRVLRFRPGMLLLGGISLAAVPAAAQVTPTTGALGLGTLVNGVTSPCLSGLCAISGGTAASGNLFHRLDNLDTRGAITSVSVQNSGFNSVIIGVLSATTINKPFSLNQPARLVLLSPAGISLQPGFTIQNASAITLTSATGLRIGSGVFDAVQTTAGQASQLTGLPAVGRAALLSDPLSLSALGLSSNGDLSIDGGLLTVDQNLLLDAQAGRLLLNNAQLQAPSGTINLHGERLELSLSDLSVASATGRAGEIRVEAGQIQLSGSSLLASGPGGGGQVYVGGGERGANPDIRNATISQVDGSSRIEAEGLQGGDGGLVVVHGSTSAWVEGALSVRAAQFGKAGLVDTSGGALLIDRLPDLTSLSSSGGTWRLGAGSLRVQTAAGSSPGSPTDFSPVRSSLIEDALQTGSVILESRHAASQQGAIRIDAPLSWNSRRLSLIALNSIAVNADLIASGTGALSFHYGQGSATGNGSSYSVQPAAKVQVPLAQQAFLWKKGSGGTEYPVILNNNSLRFWVNSESDVSPLEQFAFNGAGALQQPAFKDSAGQWQTITYDTYPLEYAIGVGGSGASEWNTNGAIVQSGNNTSYLSSDYSQLAISNASMNLAGYREGSGLVTTTIDISPPGLNGALLSVENQVTLAANASEVRIDTSIANRATSGTISNVRSWYGISDDWLEGDSPNKTRGTFSSDRFQALGALNETSNAIQVSSGSQRLIFSSPSSGTYTSFGRYGSFYAPGIPSGSADVTAVMQNPQGPYANGGPSDGLSTFTGLNGWDGSYAIYRRLADLTPNSSASTTYFIRANPSNNSSNSSGSTESGSSQARNPAPDPILEIVTNPGVLGATNQQPLNYVETRNPLPQTTGAAPTATPLAGSEPLLSIRLQSSDMQDGGGNPEPGPTPLVIPKISAIDKATATQQYIQQETAAQQETSRLLGLEGDSDIAPSPEEIQLLLQKVIRSQGNRAYVPAVLRLSITAQKPAKPSDPPQSFIDLTLIPAKGELVGRRIEINTRDFTDLLRRLYLQLSRQEPLGIDDPAAPARQLYRLLLEPLRSDLSAAGVTTLLLSADPGLQAVPFTALHDGRAYVGESFALSLTPALGLMPLDVPPQGSSRVMVAGASRFNDLNPLPLVPQELRGIAGAVGENAAETYLNETFTPGLLLNKAADRQFDRVHLATHAEFLPGGPSKAKLYTGSQAMSLGDFASLRQRRGKDPLQLFVLSACRTALGDRDSELGFAGLALQAGARSAVGTLWYVDDVATSAFFVQFYRHLQKGLPKAEALQATRTGFARGEVKLRNDRLIGSDGTALLENLSTEQQRRIERGIEHPFFWAGISLLGTPW